jgi:hypothetical protein
MIREELLERIRQVRMFFDQRIAIEILSAFLGVKVSGDQGLKSLVTFAFFGRHATYLTEWTIPGTSMSPFSNRCVRHEPQFEGIGVVVRHGFD